jgi:hypothetical protein
VTVVPAVRRAPAVVGGLLDAAAVLPDAEAAPQGVELPLPEVALP